MFVYATDFSSQQQEPLIVTASEVNNDDLWKILASKNPSFLKTFHFNGFELYPRFDTRSQKQVCMYACLGCVSLLRSGAFDALIRRYDNVLMHHLHCFRERADS